MAHSRCSSMQKPILANSRIQSFEMTGWGGGNRCEKNFATARYLTNCRGGIVPTLAQGARGAKDHGPNPGLRSGDGGNGTECLKASEMLFLGRDSFAAAVV